MTEKTYERTFIRRLLNCLLLFPIRTGLGPARLHLLTVHGRKSGQPYTTPVSIIEQGGQRYLVSPYGEVSWVKNARAHGEVILSRAGRSVTYRITEVTPEEAGPVLREYVQRESITEPYFDAEPNAPVEAFVAEADRHPVFRLEPA